MSFNFCEQVLAFFQKGSQSIRDKRNDHGAVDESSLEQQIREFADHTLIVRKNWSSRSSATGSYVCTYVCTAGRKAGCETKSS